MTAATTSMSPAWFSSVCRVVFPRSSSSQAFGVPDDITQLWHEQGFTFVDPKLTSWREGEGNISISGSGGSSGFPSEEQLSACGLAQLKNGPCGLLASTYAYMIRFLLFEPTPLAVVYSSSSASSDASSSPSVASFSSLLRPQQALCDALSYMIWQSRKNTENIAHIVLINNEAKTPNSDNNTNNSNSSTPLSLLSLLQLCGVGKIDGESTFFFPQYFSFLSVHTVSSLTEIRQLVLTHFQQFLSPGGILLFLFSLVLTRTVEEIKKDGLGQTSLICLGNGHCRHEMVNLLLIGKATPIYHDASNEVACGLLGPGLEEAGWVGFLPPPNEQAMLGNCMKQPKLPIWVVLGGAHYTVLFSPARSNNSTPNNQNHNFTLLSPESFSKPTSEQITIYHFNGLHSLRWRGRDKGGEGNNNNNQKEMSGPRLAVANVFFFDWQQESQSSETLAKFASNLDVKDMPWACVICTFKNTPAASVCVMCTSVKPVCVVCEKCTTQNSGGSVLCTMCNSALPQPLLPKPSTEPWNCSVCGSRQPGAAQACNMCTSLRPSPSSSSSTSSSSTTATAASSTSSNKAPDLSFFKCVQQDDEKELSQLSVKQKDKARPDGSRYLFLVQPSSPSLLPPPVDSWMCAKCNKETPISSVHCRWCDSLHPCSASVWWCNVCLNFNPGSITNCTACTAERVVTSLENKNYKTEPPAGATDVDAPYLCHTCSARNSVLVAPFRCAVCNSSRFIPWLAYWQSFSQLSAPSKKAAYKMLPEIMFSLHILHPKTSIHFPKESVPSLTT